MSREKGGNRGDSVERKEKRRKPGNEREEEKQMGKE